MGQTEIHQFRNIIINIVVGVDIKKEALAHCGSIILSFIQKTEQKKPSMIFGFLGFFFCLFRVKFLNITHIMVPKFMLN